MSVLKISGISKKVGENVVLNNISFSHDGHKKMAIAGETGSGKSTLLKIIGGLVQPTSGEVWFNDERILGPEEKLIPGHSRIAYLSQHFELRNNYRVEELLEMANKMSDNDAAVIFEICRITHLLKRKTDQLSGGEKQRTATARLLINSPEVLLLDEPFSNLDIIHKNILRSVINDISDKLKLSCIIVSHDPLDMLSWAEEIMIMKEGIIVQQATPEEIYKQPANEYVAALFGSYNNISADLGQLFSNQKLKITAKNLILRPEDFIIVESEKGALMAEVIKTSFFGSFYQSEVLVEDTIIKVTTYGKRYHPGDLVYISLNLNDKNFG